ncbi:MAG: hypothetical protein QOH64_3014 [Acidimicrobiaceae bacterium]
MTRAREIGIVAAIAVTTRLPSLFLPLFNRDESTVATIAHAMSAGDRLYTGTVDRKPPVVFWLTQATFAVTGSHDLRWLRAVALVFVIATALVLAREIHHRHPEVPVVLGAGVFLLAIAAFPPEDAQAAGFELIMLLPFTLAFVDAAAGRPLRAGLWLGLAGLCKQTGVLAAPAVAFALWRRHGWRAVIVAGGVTLVVLAAPMLLYDPHEYIRWVLTSNDAYVSLDGLGSVAGRALAMGALLGVSQLGLIAGAIVASRRGSVAADAWLWLAGAMLGALLGLRFFGHYFLPVIPALVLIASPALAAGCRHRRAALGAVAASAVVWVGLAFVPDRVNPTQPYERPAARIAALTTPGERIFVWGQVSQLYWASNRLPASRFPHIGFITGITGGRSDEVPYAHPVAGALRDLLADFQLHPPVLVADAASLLDRGDRYPLATSPISGFVRDGYCLVDTVDGVDLWLQRTVADRAGGC